MEDEVLIEAAARAEYEAVRAHCIAHHGTGGGRPAWEGASESQKAFARTVARLGDVPDAALHEAWVNQKTAEGWVYGESKSAPWHTHPCLVPLGQLSKFHAAKYQLAQEVVLAVQRAYRKVMTP